MMMLKLYSNWFKSFKISPNFYLAVSIFQALSSIVTFEYLLFQIKLIFNILFKSNQVKLLIHFICSVELFSYIFTCHQMYFFRFFFLHLSLGTFRNFCHISVNSFLDIEKIYKNFNTDKNLSDLLCWIKFSILFYTIWLLPVNSFNFTSICQCVTAFSVIGLWLNLYHEYFIMWFF